MKTTIELPDAVFREAKIHAATQGVTFKDLVTGLLEERLRNPSTAAAPAKPWMKFAGVMGKSKALRAESRRIKKLIEDEFEKIEPEDRL